MGSHGLTPLHLCLLAVLGLFAVAESAQAQDWPRWRGPDGNGISTETQWNPSALAGQPKILWKASVGTGFSSMAVRGNLLYTLGNENDTDTVYCLDAETGKKVWSYSYPCALGSYPGPRSTPFVDGESVYTLSQEGHLFSFNAGTGKVRWKKHLVNDFGANPPMWNFAGSPVAAGNLLLLNAGKAGLALDKNTGAKVWSSGSGPGGYSTPVLAEYGGRSAMVIFGQRAVYGVDILNGAPLWSFDWQTDSDVNAADPVAFDGKVFVASAYDRGCAVYDVSSSRPAVVWRSGVFKTHFSSFVLIDGFIYGIDGDARQQSAGVLRCVEARTGKVAWSANLGFGSLISVGGRLIVLNGTGTIIVADASASGYRELAKTSLPRYQYWTPPAFSRGRLFVRNLRGDLFSIDTR